MIEPFVLLHSFYRTAFLTARYASLISISGRNHCRRFKDLDHRCESREWMFSFHRCWKLIQLSGSRFFLYVDVVLTVCYVLCFPFFLNAVSGCDNVHLRDSFRVRMIGTIQYTLASVSLTNCRSGRHLHCGDMRYSKAMDAWPALQKPFSTVFLDTTYCNPNFAFPSQESMIDFVSTFCGRICSERSDVRIVVGMDVLSSFIEGSPDTYCMIGAYSIGKERLAVSVAEVRKIVLSKKVHD